ncbi:PEX10 factor, partial [Neodrepanis coruscans]|nr:PEX10 factor [Neodrepanis coruscans]
AMSAAGPARLVRGGQKDDLYRAGLRSGAGTALRGLAGARPWLEWRRELELLCDGAYFVLTTLSGNGAGHRLLFGFVPSVSAGCHRLEVAALLNVGVCLVSYNCLLLNVTPLNRPVSSSDAAYPHRDMFSKSKIFFFRETNVPHHEKYPCFNPLMYCFLDRNKNPKPLKVPRTPSDKPSLFLQLHFGGVQGEEQSIQSSYKLLGVISLLHLLLTIVVQVHSLRQRQRARQEWKLHRGLALQRNPGKDTSGRQSRCTLCLEERRHSTATPCGHLFCWECITAWCNTRAECPLCREKFPPQKLIYLRHYQL